MLPQSMAQTMRWGSEGWVVGRAAASLRPPNVALKRSRETRAFAIWLAVWVALSVLVGVAHVWLRIRVLELGYDRSATRSIIQKLEMEGQSLTAQVETLESPARLEKVARARFNMVRVMPGQQAVLP
jgi:cell division protein FtsB